MDEWRRELSSYTSNKGTELALKLVESNNNVDDQVKYCKHLIVFFSSKPEFVGYDSVIKCLIDTHSKCAPRHVLQRNLARCIETCAVIYEDAVHDAIKDCLLNLISLDKYQLCIDYTQSLMEHYSPGLIVLESLLPQVLEYMINHLRQDHQKYLINNQQSSSDHESFMSLVKVLLNVLHNTSSTIKQTLHPQSHSNTSPRTHFNVNPEFHSNTSPQTQSDTSSQTHSDSNPQTCSNEWLKSGLMDIVSTCKSILSNGDVNLPKDLVISVSMLYVVSIGFHDNVPSVLNELYSKWFGDVMSATNGLIMSATNGLMLSRLCIVHALLAKLPSSLLCEVYIDECSDVLYCGLFIIICSLLDYFTESSYKFLASRTLSSWTSLLSSCSDQLSHDLSPESEVISKVLKYIWSLWEDPIEGVRHQCKNIFESLIRLYHNNQPHLLTLSNALLALSSPTRGKYMLLRSIIPYIDVRRVINEWPHLPNELMSVMNLQVLACRAGDLWCVMSTKYYKESPTDQWIEVWLHPMVRVLLTAPMLTKQHIKQYCLSDTLNTPPNGLEVINQVIKDLSHDLMSCDTTSILVAQLMCMECSMINGRGQCGSNELAVLACAIQHRDEQIVISALRLLCESKRSTELVSLSHLPLISKCLLLHMNSQSPSFRNQTITIFRKLLTRICDSCHCNAHNSMKKHHQIPNEISERIESYKVFLSNICERCFHTLHPLSNFQRRNLALSLLHVSCCVLSPLTLPSTIKDIFKFRGLFPDPSSVESLVYILYDSFDDNRNLSLQLLDKLITEHSLPKESLLHVINKVIIDYSTLITSPKSSDCATGYRVTQLLVRHFLPDTVSCLYGGLPTDPSCSPAPPTDSSCSPAPPTDPSCSPAPPTDPSCSPAPPTDPSCSIINCLLVILEHHLTLSSQNLMKASITTPMYGVIQAIRGAIEELDSKFYNSNEVGVVIDSLVHVCVCVGQLVSPIVCNSSPEGFTMGQHIVEEDLTCEIGNSQSLLVCCWRSMKECIQLLSLVIDIIQEHPHIEFNNEQLISELILHQLTKAYHRGAFEIAHIGFVKLCKYLWNIPIDTDGLGSRKPVIWVEELLQSLKSPSMTKLLSITRRSAGLPFYVQAILTTEPTSSGRSCLKHVVGILLDIASSHSVPSDIVNDITTDPFEDVPQPSSVHAINILRGLYRDNKLGEHMTPYITEGIKIAIRGFAVEYWPVRNSCTLLFSTLVMRIFGVKRVQDERSIENKMSSREFFSRFPSLHYFLLQELNQSQHQHIFPVLLILSRLYPSPLDDVNSPISLTPFQPHILRACGSPIWKCRVLASDAFLPTLSSSNISDILCALPSELSLRDQNKTHGMLLLMLSILKHSSPLGEEPIFALTTITLSSLFTGLISQPISYLGLKKNSCTITRGLYVTLVSLLIPHIDHTPHVALIEWLIMDAYDDLISGRLQGLPLSKELPSALLDLLIVTKDIVKTDYIPLLVKLYPFNGDLVMNEIQYHANSFTTQQLNTIAEISVFKALIESKEEGFVILSTLLSKSFSGYIPSQMFTVTTERLCQGYLKESLVVAMVNCLSYILPILMDSITQYLLTDLLNLMYTWCSDIYPDVYRHAIASFLGINWKHLIYNYNSKRNAQPNFALFWLMVIYLLQDIEGSVRDEMCRSITSMTNPDSSLCQSQSLYNVIMSIPDLYKHDHDRAVSLLSSIVNNFNVSSLSSSQDKVSALLFEEDKPNSYCEPVIVMEYVALAYDQLSNDIVELSNGLQEMTIQSNEQSGTNTSESDTNTPNLDTNTPKFDTDTSESDTNTSETSSTDTPPISINFWEMKTSEVLDIFKGRILKLSN